MKFKDIKTHADACQVLGKNPQDSITTDQKITDVCKAVNQLNNNWKPDFNKHDQLKYRPFFIMDASGFRFGHSDCDISYSCTGVGSRLCHYVGSREEADYLGQTFIELHKEHYFGE